MSAPTSRIAVVTGASAGIGLAVAESLIARGDRVVVNARKADRLNALADRFNTGRSAPIAVAGDASDQSVINAMLNAAKSRFGDEANLVVVNAGRGLKGSVADSDTAQWEEMIRTNVLGAALLMREAAHRMLKSIESLKPAAPGEPAPWLSRPHDIVVIGSTVGRNVSPYSSMYGSTKFAVHGLAEGLRRELGPKGIRVSLVAPAFVVSEFQGVAGYDPQWFKGVQERIGPVLSPDDVARLVAFITAQSPAVHVADVIVRPTRQDYP